MQSTDSVEICSKSLENPKKPGNENSVKPSEEEGGDVNSTGDESILDVSGKNLEFSVLENSEETLEGLYLYKNVFNLMPVSLGRLGKLKIFKFFGNDFNLFPPEFRNLVGLEYLQVKVSSPGLNGLSLSNFKGLKELELSKVPRRPFAFPILSEIAGLKSLTKLSVCHFSIRYLPPEIGCLNNLEYLDLSFNKMKRLPAEIKYLNALISLKVANNKLEELPSGWSSLQRLENLDLSNNRLTSLENLELGSMQNLQSLNLQYNKLLNCCHIPSWISCNLEGNINDTFNDDAISSSVEMDVYETSFQENHRSLSSNGSHRNSSSLITGSSTNSRCLTARRSGKRWKRRYYIQQRARQERLNCSRKWKGEDHTEVLTMESIENFKPVDLDVLAFKSHLEDASESSALNDDKLSGEVDSETLIPSVHKDDIGSKKRFCVENCPCGVLDCITTTEGGEEECSDHDVSLASITDEAGEQDEGSTSNISKSTPTSKRHCDGDLDNPKPCKYRKPTDDNLSMSRKYSFNSFCSIEDYLPDGFYDAGRDRPFMPLRSYEQNLHLDSREVILVDRNRDEELDAIALSAQALIFRLKRLNVANNHRGTVDNLQIAYLLALFVSDHFGGSDRSALMERTRKAVSGSNYRKPFVCTCSTGNSESLSSSTKQLLDTVDIVFTDLCEKSLRSIKAKRKSITIPIGVLQFGVCRHRALLMKYLCDRMDPPVPCELVRGYLDFLPHAWNIIHINRGGLWIRMVVDACRPHDIREETDPEYYCRYIPLTRTKVSFSNESSPCPGCTFPSISTCDEIERAPSSSLIRCKFGSIEAAAKVRTLEVHGTLPDDIKKFEFSCIGEVRILGALKHSCIVEMYGHQISSKWVPAVDGNPEHRILQSTILMEYVKGGSLKSHIEMLVEAGEKCIPVELAMYIARDVACALAELHSKHIIHRDIKSENILIDLDSKRDDGTPVVKLCDFDRAVPARSFMHACCIAHLGIPPPDVCVGTPRWMAPEVLRAMYKSNIYGLEVDIWSFGCLLLELLTLQVPYSESSETHFHNLLQNGKRPPLTDELEALASQDDSAVSQSDTELDGAKEELESLRFLVDLFRQCTMDNPIERLTAEELYKKLLERTSNLNNPRS